MKWKYFGRLATLQVAGIVLLVSADAQVQPSLLTASGQEVTVGLVSPGTLECIGGKPLVPPPNPFTLCSPETTAVHIRGQVGQASYQNIAGTATDMFNGMNEIVTNCNLDGGMKGYCWGTFRWTIPDRGLWAGVWYGEFDLQTFTIKYTASGYGEGNALEGMQMSYDAVYSGQPLGTFVVRVLSLPQK